MITAVGCDADHGTSLYIKFEIRRRNSKRKALFKIQMTANVLYRITGVMGFKQFSLSKLHYPETPILQYSKSNRCLKFKQLLYELGFHQIPFNLQFSRGVGLHGLELSGHEGQEVRVGHLDGGGRFFGGPG